MAGVVEYQATVTERRFLAFLAEDMAAHPEAIRPVSGDLVARIDMLVRGVEVDLDSALPVDAE